MSTLLSAGTAPAAAPAQAPRSAYLRLRSVAKSFRHTAVIENLDFEIARGEFVSLLGPSGCGKTTMLRMIAGLLSADRGSITLDGRDITAIPPHQRDVGVVFQNYALFPHLTVQENIAFGLQARGASRAELQAAVPAALDLVRMREYAERPIHALSGGQQQRVAVARALAVKPKLLLLDEPLSALDRKLRETMQIELRRILRAQGITAIFVTHDQDEALVMSDRIAVMNAGRIEQIGSPADIYERPATSFALEFVGLSSRLAGTVESVDGELMRVRTALGTLQARASFRSGARVLVAVRPEHVTVGAPGAGDNTATLTVEDVVYLGAKTQVYLQDARAGDDARLMFEVAGRADLAAGTPVTVRWPVADTLVYPYAAAT